MAERIEVITKVISQKGSCGFGHKVNDEWVIGGTTPDGMCIPAFFALFPKLRVLAFGGDRFGDVTTAACPDAENPVVFELRRLRQ